MKLTDAESSLLLGVFVLILSLFVWRLTGNFWGWLALFAPGTAYLGRGFYLAYKELMK